MATVLIIEDCPDIRENVAEILLLQAYEVHAAADGPTGIEMANRLLPHLILCDVLMPGANGYDVFNTLKGNPATAAIPFIFLTANAEKSHMKAGLDMGASAYIRKPFEMEELLETVAGCLRYKP